MTMTAGVKLVVGSGQQPMLALKTIKNCAFEVKTAQDQMSIRLGIDMIIANILVKSVLCNVVERVSVTEQCFPPLL